MSAVVVLTLIVSLKQPPFDPMAPPRYYDGPPMPEYSSSRSRAEKRSPPDVSLT